MFNDLMVLDWGDLVDSDMIINATSIGLKKEDDFEPVSYTHLTLPTIAEV